jgi:uroporphyrinogen decarboxylase
LEERIMTSRERVIAALEHREPDKVPIDFGGVHTSLHASAHKNLMKYLGFKGPDADIQEICQQIVYPDQRLLDVYETDIIGVYPRSSSTWKLEIDASTDEWLDEWGTRWVRPDGGFFYDIKDPVMKDFSLEDLKSYEFPDPSDSGRIEGLREEVEALYNQTDKAIIFFNASWGLWESLWLLRGFEQAYIDIATDTKFVEAIFDKLLWWGKSYWNLILDEVGDLIQVVQLGDDLGSQRGPVFKPETYRSLLKPRHKELVQFIKSHTKAKIYFHTCGSIHWAIRDFIECGIDILNPVQVGAHNMDSRKLMDEFGADICFWGGGCDTDILLRGSPKDVEKEVKRRIDDFSPGGGFVFASIHNIQANTPPKNIHAMYSTAVKHRNYRK